MHGSSRRVGSSRSSPLATATGSNNPEPGHGRLAPEITHVTMGTGGNR